MYTILLYFSAAMPCPGHGQRREKKRGALSASFFRNSFQVRSGLKWWRGNINDNKPQRNPPAQWRNAMPSYVLPATVISDGHPNRHHHHNSHPPSSIQPFELHKSPQQSPVPIMLQFFVLENCGRPSSQCSFP